MAKEIRVKVSFWVNVPKRSAADLEGDDDDLRHKYVEDALTRIVDEGYWSATAGEVIGPID